MKASTPDHQPTASDAKQQTSLVREKILAEAKAAGKAGIHVNDLAAKVSLDARYLRSWMSRIPALRKIGEGLYRFIELPVNSTPYPLGSYRQLWTLEKRELKLHTAKLMEEIKVQAEQYQAEAKAAGVLLKERILVELKAAGTKGVRVKELAKTLGLSNSRLSTWFATTGKQCPEIARLRRGTYRLRLTPLTGCGEAQAAPLSALLAVSPPKRRPDRRRLTPCKGCGELTAEILAGLKAVSPSGIRVRDLATNLGLPSLQVSNWFSRTAKQFACVERMQFGIYRYVEPPLAAQPANQPQSPVRRVRGGLTELILAALKAAGEAGLSCNAFAEQLQRPGLSLSNWYLHTGRRIPGVERIGPALYRFLPGSHQKPPTLRRGRGGLTELILTKLKAAGEAGLSLKILAKHLRQPTPSITSWYQTTGRRIPGVEHIGRGLYRFNPGGFPNPKPAPLRTPLTQLILGELKAAGSEGLCNQALAARTGLTTRQVSTWFERNGQRVPGIERIGPGVHRFNPGSTPL